MTKMRENVETRQAVRVRENLGTSLGAAGRWVCHGTYRPSTVRPLSGGSGEQIAGLLSY